MLYVVIIKSICYHCLRQNAQTLYRLHSTTVMIIVRWYGNNLNNSGRIKYSYFRLGISGLFICRADILCTCHFRNDWCSQHTHMWNCMIWIKYQSRIAHITTNTSVLMYSGLWLFINQFYRFLFYRKSDLPEKQYTSSFQQIWTSLYFVGARNSVIGICECTYQK